MSHEQLVAEVIKLRTAVRAHRDGSGHDLCWHHPNLWSTLPEQTDPEIAIAPWPQFLRDCVAYRASLDEQAPAARVHRAEYDERGNSWPSAPRRLCVRGDGLAQNRA